MHQSRFIIIWIKPEFGWKVYATDVSASRLSFADAMKCYRNEYRIERIFNRLKSQYVISPLFVKRDDQAEGLTNLLTLGVRVATLIQYVARRSLEESEDTLTGLHLSLIHISEPTRPY